ncbi:MAG TPA: alkaline phosphatase family protein [Terriglobales bacterium]|nr:alkaline phosphatase family protein [Terriglobales bacterium]
MRTWSLSHSIVSLILVFALAISMSSCGGTQAASTTPPSNPPSQPPSTPPTQPPPPPPTPTDITALNHIVFMFQENRSFDHYFGHLNTYRVNKGWGGKSDVNTLDSAALLAAGFSADNPADDSAPLSWTTANATTVTLNGESVTSSGNKKETPTTATLYTLVATSATGATAQASVVVGTTPDTGSRLLVGASPMNVEPGGKSLLTWAATDGSSVTISPPPDPKHTQAYGPNATAAVTVPTTPGTVTYTLTTDSKLTATITLTVASSVPGAPIATITDNNQGHVSWGSDVTVHSFLLTDQCVEDFSPDWLESHGAYNRDDAASDEWKGNGFVHITAGFSQFANSQNDTHHYFDVRGQRNMGYYDEKTLPFYYFLAGQFGTSDNFFSPIPSNSGPNRVAELAATTHGHAHNPPTLNIPSIFQLLDEAGVSWKVYYSDVSSSGVPLTTLTNFQWGQGHKDPQHLAPVNCKQASTPCQQGQTDYFTDLSSGNFPAVALIEPGFDSGRDEHPGNPVQLGAVYEKSLISAFMDSPIWKDSAFFLTYDEAGGFYDHVQPVNNDLKPDGIAVQPDGIAPQDLLSKDPKGDFTRTGFRVPLMVVSPYVIPHVVSHAPADSTAILKFIETRFKLRNMTNRDAAQPDFAKEFFDFSKPALLTLTSKDLPDQQADAPCAAYAKNP